MSAMRRIKSLMIRRLEASGYVLLHRGRFDSLVAAATAVSPTASAPAAGGNAGLAVAGPASAPTSEIEANRPTADVVDEAIYTPVFNYDGLRTDPRVIHNHDFMRDPRYIEAYTLAHRALGLDHKMFWRLHVALWCAERAARLDGDFVECGVWRGFLTTAILSYLDWESLSHRFYLFDTFDGLDARYLTENERANREKLDHLNKHYTGVYGPVRDHFSRYPRIQLVPGTVPDTLSTVPIERVAYLSLDMNCALPEIAAAEYFWDRMVPGSAMLLDDYGFVSYEDQKRAFDRFAAERHVPLLALPSGQGLILKP